MTTVQDIMNEYKGDTSANKAVRIIRLLRDEGGLIELCIGGSSSIIAKYNSLNDLSMMTGGLIKLGYYVSCVQPKQGARDHIYLHIKPLP